MEISAKLNYLRMAPRKVRLVADLIRGKPVPVAERMLGVLRKRASGPLLKLLRSAMANARHNFRVANAEDLRIRSITVNTGPTLERIRPRAFGRAFPIRKRTSHVSLVLETVGRTPSAKRAKPADEVRPITPSPKVAGGEGVRKPEIEREAFRVRPKAKTKPTEFVRRMFRRKAI